MVVVKLSQAIVLWSMDMWMSRGFAPIRLSRSVCGRNQRFSFACISCAVLAYKYAKVWDVCEELQTFIQDSKEVLWSEVRHIPDTANAFVGERGQSYINSTFGLVGRWPIATYDRTHRHEWQARREYIAHCSEPQVAPESLEDDAKAQMKNVKAAGHKEIRWCGAYKVGAQRGGSKRIALHAAPHTQVDDWLESLSCTLLAFGIGRKTKYPRVVVVERRSLFSG